MAEPEKSELKFIINGSYYVITFFFQTYFLGSLFLQSVQINLFNPSLLLLVSSCHL